MPFLTFFLRLIFGVFQLVFYLYYTILARKLFVWGDLSDITDRQNKRIGLAAEHLMRQQGNRERTQKGEPSRFQCRWFEFYWCQTDLISREQWDHERYDIHRHGMISRCSDNPPPQIDYLRLNCILFGEIKTIRTCGLVDAMGQLRARRSGV